VAEFLSADWFAALGSVDVATDPALTFRLDQSIIGRPGGDVRYRVTLAAGRLHVDGDVGDEPADASLRLAYPTALDLATGRRTAHEALIAGEVRFSGDPARIQDLAAAIGAIGSALEALRDDTTWP